MCKNIQLTGIRMIIIIISKEDAYITGAHLFVALVCLPAVAAPRSAPSVALQAKGVGQDAQSCPLIGRHHLWIAFRRRLLVVVALHE